MQTTPDIPPSAGLPFDEPDMDAFFRRMALGPPQASPRGFETGLPHDLQTAVFLVFANGGDRALLDDVARLADRGPDHPMLRMLLGGRYYRLGDFDGLQKAIRQYQIAKRLSPGWFEPVAVLGHLFYVKRDLKNAMNFGRQALSLATSDEQRASAVGLFAAIAVAAGDMDRAVEHLHEAYLIYPEDDEVLAVLAHVLINRQREAEAIEILASNPLAKARSSRLVGCAVRALLALDRIDDAVDEVTKAVEQRPCDAILRCNLAATLSTANRDVEALVQYGKAIELFGNSEHREVAVPLTHQSRGLAILKIATSSASEGLPTELLNQAAADLDIALQSDPDNAGVMSALAVVDHLRGNYQEAADRNRRALALDPSNAVALANLDREMALLRAHECFQELERAATEPDNEQTFVRTLAAIDLAPYNADGLGLLTRLAFKAGAHAAARSIASYGAQKFPRDAWLSRVASTMSPGEARLVPAASSSDRELDARWIEANALEYSGHWVALRDGTLIFASSDPAEIGNRLADIQGAFVTRIEP